MTELGETVTLLGPVPRTYPERNWSMSGRVQTPDGLIEDTVPEDTSLIDCNAPETTCTVGWRLHGKLTTATLVYHVEPDHPTWLVGRDHIPQPGAYSHFHWSDTAQHPDVGSTHTGYLLQLKAIDTFCFVLGDHEAFQTDLTCEDETNRGVIVQPGIDIATHLNIVGSYPGYEAP